MHAHRTARPLGPFLLALLLLLFLLALLFAAVFLLAVFLLGLFLLVLFLLDAFFDDFLLAFLVAITILLGGQMGADWGKLHPRFSRRLPHDRQASAFLVTRRVECQGYARVDRRLAMW